MDKDYIKLKLYYLNKLKHLQLELSDLRQLLCNLHFIEKEQNQLNGKNQNIQYKYPSLQEKHNESKEILNLQGCIKFIHNSEAELLGNDYFKLRQIMEKSEKRLKKMILQNRLESMDSSKLQYYYVLLDRLKTVQNALNYHKNVPIECLGIEQQKMIRRNIIDGYNNEEKIYKEVKSFGKFNIKQGEYDEIFCNKNNTTNKKKNNYIQKIQHIQPPQYVDEIQMQSETQTSNNELSNHRNQTLISIKLNCKHQKTIIKRLEILEEQQDQKSKNIKYCNNNIHFNNNINLNHNIQSLYNSVWYNSKLKKKILKFLSYFNYFSINIEFNSIREWNLFQHKEYLNQVTFNFKIELNSIPHNINTVKLLVPIDDCNSDQIQSVPEWINSVSLTLSIPNLYSSNFKLISISKLTSLQLYSKDFILPEIPANILPSTLNELRIDNIYRYCLKKDVLPINLKKLTVYNLDIIEDDAIPESLVYFEATNLDPKLLSKFPPKGLVHLKITNNKFNYYYNKSIIFPHTLESLEISSCSYFNTDLPDSLKSFKLVSKVFLKEISYPSSLEHLHIEYIRFEKVENRNKLPESLKSLYISCNTILHYKGESILPDGLIKLVFLNGFNITLEKKHLPKKLQYLDLGDDYIQPLHENVLPENLSTLILGKNYNLALIPAAIPQNLKILDIRYKYYHPNYIALLNPFTIIKNQYIESHFFEPSNHYYPDQIYAIKIPEIIEKDPISYIQFNNLPNLKHLHLGYFNKDININNIPKNNNIISIHLNLDFNQDIHLNHFIKLQTIILNPIINKSLPKIIISKDKKNNKQLHSFKNIIIKSPSYNNNQFINNNIYNNIIQTKINILKNIDIKLLKYIKIQN